MSFFDVFSEMLVILFCMAAGFLAHKLGYLSKQTDQNLCRLLLGIIVPCLILGSVSAGDTLPSTEEMGWVSVPLPLCPTCWVEQSSSSVSGAIR